MNAVSTIENRRHAESGNGNALNTLAPDTLVLDTLAITTHPCGEKADQNLAPLVLLHGWASNSQVWQPLIALLSPHVDVITVDLPGFGQSTLDDSIPSEHPYYNLDALLLALEKALPRHCNLLGWSLGGMLATAFAGRYPQRVNTLITIASNASFVHRPGWRAAMPVAVFNEFCGFFSQQPLQCLKRFHGLQCSGDQNERALLKQLRAEFGEPGGDAWLQALGLLGEMDNRNCLKQLRIPGLHLFGDGDALVPAGAAKVISGLNSCQQTLTLPDTGHIPHLSCPDLLAKQVTDFLVSSSEHNRYRRDKARVAESFGRAAASYDSLARLQKQVGQQLMEALPVIEETTSPKTSPVILDLGCGTGYFTDMLAEKYPHATVIGLDIAEGMLSFASDNRKQSRWLCGDADALPLAFGSVDLVFSSLALQWLEQLPELAAELARVLVDDGVLAYSTLVQGTLDELRSAWAQVDNYVHVNQFYPESDWQSAFAEHFSCIEFEMEDVCLHYTDLKHLTRELKGIGAHNINSGQKGSATTRADIRQLVQSYEEFRSSAGLPATWRVAYSQTIKRG